MPEIDQSTLDIVVSICLGLGLSAACGFRVFVPLLGLSIAAMSGRLQPAEGWEWVGSWPALICLATATVLEIGAYYIPWIDNALDSIATPAAYIAGALVTLSVVSDLPPMWRWSLALIAGGGIAGLIQAATVTLRGTSTVTTGGLGNFVVSTGEFIFSLVTTWLAIMLPIVGAVLVVVILVWVVFRLTSGKRGGPLANQRPS